MSLKDYQQKFLNTSENKRFNTIKPTIDNLEMTK